MRTGQRDDYDGRRLTIDADGRYDAEEWDPRDEACLDAALRLAVDDGPTSNFEFYRDHVPKLIAEIRRLRG